MKYLTIVCDILELRTDKEPDLLPEHCTYRDEGCELSPACLDCPLPRCILEQRGGKQHLLKRLRDRDIVRAFACEGSTTRELAKKFNVSVRTIRRALRRKSNE